MARVVTPVTPLGRTCDSECLSLLGLSHVSHLSHLICESDARDGGHARGRCVRADGHAAVTADTVFSDYLTAAVTAAANQAAAELAGARAMLSVRRRMAR